MSSLCARLERASRSQAQAQELQVRVLVLVLAVVGRHCCLPSMQLRALQMHRLVSPWSAACARVWRRRLFPQPLQQMVRLHPRLHRPQPLVQLQVLVPALLPGAALRLRLRVRP